MLNRSGYSRHPCLVPHFRGKSFSFSSLSRMLPVGLSYITFVMLRYILSMPSLRVFIMRGYWILSKIFLYLLRWSHDLKSFILLMWCITFIDLCILSHPCIPGINPTRSWCMILSLCFWIYFASILLRIFASIFITDIALYFSFLWYPCIALGNASLVKYVCLEIFLLWFFGRVWE